jgi:hypothetical protein
MIKVVVLSIFDIALSFPRVPDRPKGPVERIHEPLARRSQFSLLPIKTFQTIHDPLYHSIERNIR